MKFFPFLSAALAASSLSACFQGVSARSQHGVVAATPLTDRHVIPMTDVLIFAEANYHIDVDAAIMSEANGRYSYYGDGACQRDGRFFGSARVNSSFLRRMQQYAGIDLALSDVDTSDDTILHKVETTHLAKSSPVHTDAIVGKRGRFRRRHEEGHLPVGFYVLKDNPGAYFEIGDDELCIPVVEGSFVTFNGRRPHRTVINTGSVDLLGPFEMFGGEGVQLASRYETGTVGNLGSAKDSVTTRRELAGEDLGIVVAGTTDTNLAANTDEEISAIQGHFLKINATGLPTLCDEDCSIHIALLVDDSQECTQEAHGNATKAILSNEIFYETDDQGSTGGWHKQMFNLIEKDVSLEYAAVFLLDADKALVACAFLEPLSAEMKEMFDKMFNGEQDSVVVDGNSDVVGALGDGGAPSDGNVVLPAFAICVIAAVAGALLLSV